MSKSGNILHCFQKAKQKTPKVTDLFSLGVDDRKHDL